MPPSRCVPLAVIVAFATMGASSFVRLEAQQPQVASEHAAGPTVDFMAVAADGSPVADLLPADVEIRIGDRLRNIRSLRRISAAPPPPAQTPRLPPPFGTNADVLAGRRFVLVIDQESFAAGREQLFRSAIDGLLPHLTPADRTMIAALPFGGIVVPFTSDPVRLRAGIARVAGQAGRSESGSDRACRTRRFLESLDSLLRSSGEIGGPRTMVLFTAGLAGPRRDAPMGLMPGMCELLVDLFRQVGSAATGARANVYILQPADVGAGGSLTRSSVGGVGDLGSDNPFEGVENLAGVTGGQRLPLDATGTESLARVASESSSYYVAELEPDRSEVYGRSRRFSVRTTRREITVRARPDVVLSDAETAVSRRLTVTDLLSSPAPAVDLPIRAGAFTVRDPDGKLRIGVLIETSEPLTAAGAMLVDDAGHVAARWFATDPAERPLLGAMTAGPGHYLLRAAAIDRAGRPGVAESDIEAGLVEVGELSLGSLLLSASHGGNPSLQLQFSAEATARASFDIYGGAAGQRLSAVLELAHEPDGAPLATLPVTLTRADDTKVVATGTVPLGALSPGDYVVRGVIRLENGASGRVLRTLRKVPR